MRFFFEEFLSRNVQHCYVSFIRFYKTRSRSLLRMPHARTARQGTTRPAPITAREYRERLRFSRYAITEKRVRDLFSRRLASGRPLTGTREHFSIFLYLFLLIFFLRASFSRLRATPLALYDIYSRRYPRQQQPASRPSLALPNDVTREIKHIQGRAATSPVKV